MMRGGSADSVKVTIAIPTFRRVGYLRQAVESAQRQSHAALQIIVSDNASEDGTAEYLETLRGDARVLVLQQTENLGMVGNWNACLRAAEGEWFLLLSDDDYLEPDAVAAMLRACDEAAEPERVGMVYCRSRTVDGTGQTVSVGPEAPAYEEAREFAMQYFERRRVVFPCSILLRTQDLQVLGYRAEGVKLGCDAIAWSEVVLRRGAVACAGKVLSNYRVHPNNLTSTASLGYWVHDLGVLLKVWEQAFATEEELVRQRFRQAASGYLTYFLATVLSQGATGARAKVRALRSLLRHRGRPRGRADARMLLLSMGRIAVPRRVLRVLRQRTAGASG